MKLHIHPCTLQLKRAFKIAAGTRTTTPGLIIGLEHEGCIGYGEASMPPYLGETQDTARVFLSQINFDSIREVPPLDPFLAHIDSLAPGNTAAKAAIDIALHDIIGKQAGKPLHTLWNLDPAHIPPTSFTIAMGSREEIHGAIHDAPGCGIYKVKLGGDHDRAIIQSIREVTDKPLRIDVNQGWTGKETALHMIEWLAELNVELIEQPLAANQIDDTAWLRERSPLPIIADEAVKRLADVQRAAGVYDGINVKLMKSTGLHEARRMIALARSLNLKIMIGCMTETSCGISAASQIAPLADWVDLDGALLIDNDPFDGTSVQNGRIILPQRPGTGAVLKNSEFFTNYTHVNNCD